MARQYRMVLAVNQAIADEFKQLAADQGLTMSALGAYVIGQYVVTQRKLAPILDDMAKHVNEVVSEIAKDRAQEGKA